VIQIQKTKLFNQNGLCFCFEMKRLFSLNQYNDVGGLTVVACNSQIKFGNTNFLHFIIELATARHYQLLLANISTQQCLPPHSSHLLRMCQTTQFYVLITSVWSPDLAPPHEHQLKVMEHEVKDSKLEEMLLLPSNSTNKKSLAQYFSSEWTISFIKIDKMFCQISLFLILIQKGDTSVYEYMVPAMQSSFQYWPLSATWYLKSHIEPLDPKVLLKIEHYSIHEWVIISAILLYILIHLPYDFSYALWLCDALFVWLR